MVPRYNAGIACTTAILLSKFQGSAMAKALERLQGVVLGNIFGQLIYVVVARCNPLAYSAMAMVIFGWSNSLGASGGEGIRSGILQTPPLCVRCR